MAWNKPSEPKVEVKGGGGQRKVYLKGILVGAVAVVIGAVCIFAFSGKSEKPVEKGEKSGGLIKSITPAAVPRIETNVIRQAEIQPKIDPNARPTRPGQKVNGYVMLANGSLHKIRGEVHVQAPRASYAIFEHPAENIIAGILSVQPGDSVFGDREYGEDFMESFLESLKEPIILYADDSDEVKELKRAVNETKIALKDAYDRGEDVCKMISDARRDAQNAARIKQEIRREMIEYTDEEGRTDEEKEDMFTAANKLLESKGITPLEDSPITKIKLNMKDEGEGTNE